MGAGGRTSIPPPTKKSDNDHKKRVPVEKPPFSLSQLKKAIPPHCFKRSIIRSFSYVVYDLTIAFIFYYIATHYFQYLPRPLSFLAWPTYWFVQGCILTGVWVIAHECGHHAFSDYQWIDDTIGFILHSTLLTPYFSWKYSHRRHHSNTGSLEWDEVYVPKQKSNIYWYYKYINNNPLGRALIIIITLTLGFPLYLAMNVSGRPYDKFPCHFNPHGPIYSDRERLQVYISNAGLLVVFYGLYLLTMAKGFAWVVCVYGVPLLVVNGFFVLITYVHHTHLALPRFDSSEWEWMRGALLTMDRDFGILNKIFHDVTNTHVAHHLFSTIPHYHAMEATKALKPILGEYYRCDDIPFYKAIWREAGECIYIEPDQNIERKGVFWYNNKW